MNAPARFIDDWAFDVAERIVGDIPHAVFMSWAVEVPERVAAMLRAELCRTSSSAELKAFADAMVRALPDYLPEPTAARLRAKLLGALATAGALGEHFRTLQTAIGPEAREHSDDLSIHEKADP